MQLTPPYNGSGCHEFQAPLAKVRCTMVEMERLGFSRVAQRSMRPLLSRETAQGPKNTRVGSPSWIRLLAHPCVQSHCRWYRVPSFRATKRSSLVGDGDDTPTDATSW